MRFLLIPLLFSFVVKAQLTDSLLYKQENNAINLSTIFQPHIDNKDAWLTTTLSNIGGPVLFLEPFENKTHDFKYSAYDYYSSSRNKINYSPLFKFTSFHYLKANQSAQNIDALHHQSYKDFSFGVHFQSVVSQGFFDKEWKEHNDLFTEFVFHPDSSNYTSKFNFVYKKSKIRESGGFANDTVYKESLLNNNNILPVNLEEARNVLFTKHLNLENSIKLKEDSIFSLSAHFVTQYFKNFEKYQDDNPIFIPKGRFVNHIDKPFYASIQDSSGSKIDSVGESVFSQSASVLLKYKKHIFNPSINYRTNNYFTGLNQKRYHSYSVELPYQLDSVLNVSARFKNRNDLNPVVDLSASVRIKNLFNVSVENKNIAPSFFYQNYSGNYTAWQNSFTWQKLSTASVNKKILNNTLDISVFAKQMKNGIFLDTIAQPQQVNENQFHYGINVNYNKKWKRWTLFSKNRFQKSKGDWLSVPTFVSKNQLGYTFKYLGEAVFTPGIQFEYFTNYYASEYVPYISSFKIQREEKFGNYPMIDLFLNMKVKSFTAYIIFENFIQTFQKDNNFASPNYVWKNQAFRFGIRWNFYDK